MTPTTIPERHRQGRQGTHLIAAPGSRRAAARRLPFGHGLRLFDARGGDGRLPRQTSMFVMAPAAPPPSGGRFAPRAVVFCSDHPHGIRGGGPTKGITADAASTRRFVLSPPAPQWGTSLSPPVPSPSRGRGSGGWPPGKSRLAGFTSGCPHDRPAGSPDRHSPGRLSCFPDFRITRKPDDKQAYLKALLPSGRLAAQLFSLHGGSKADIAAD
jgi:hypothetical protein